MAHTTANRSEKDTEHTFANTHHTTASEKTANHSLDHSFSELKISKDDVRAQLIAMGYSPDALPEDVMEDFIDELKSLYRTELGEFLEQEIEGYYSDGSDGDDIGVHQPIVERQGVTRKGKETEGSGMGPSARAVEEKDANRDDIDGTTSNPSQYKFTGADPPMIEITNAQSSPPAPPTLNTHATQESEFPESIRLIERLASMDLSRVRQKVADQQRSRNRVGFESQGPDAEKEHGGRHADMGRDDAEDGPDVLSNFDYDLSEFDEFAPSLEEVMALLCACRSL
ncbi:hypothetical protein HDV00_007902 [Rhizophlyctis rosea]|nr:hypothetical protein HDV00_007902 [Rhizophlyctis rosea]